MNYTLYKLANDFGYKLANGFGIDPMNVGQHNPAALYTRNILYNKNVSDAKEKRLQISNHKQYKKYSASLKNFFKNYNGSSIGALYRNNLINPVPVDSGLPGIIFTAPRDPKPYLLHVINPARLPHVSDNIDLLIREQQKARYASQNKVYNPDAGLDIDHNTIIPGYKSPYNTTDTPVPGYILRLLRAYAPTTEGPGQTTNIWETILHEGLPGLGHYWTIGNLLEGTAQSPKLFLDFKSGDAGDAEYYNRLFKIVGTKGALKAIISRGRDIHRPISAVINTKDKLHKNVVPVAPLDYYNSWTLLIGQMNRLKMATARSKMPATKLDLNYGTKLFDPGNAKTGYDYQHYLVNSGLFNWDALSQQFYPANLQYMSGSLNGQRSYNRAILLMLLQGLLPSFVNKLNYMYYLKRKFGLNDPRFIRAKQMLQRGWRQANNTNANKKNYAYG